MTIRALILGVAIVAAVILLSAPPALARDPTTQPLTFHTGGSLICSSCHTMHYSEGGAPPVGADAGGPFPSLLLKRNATDLCLNCHGLGGTAPNVVTGSWPGGVFPRTAGDQGRGHNPFGEAAFPSTQILEDSLLHLTPPGNAAAMTRFTCSSCHQTHGFTDYVAGNSGVFTYRLLRKSIRNGPGGATISVPTTILSTFADEQYSETASPTNHNVYRGPATLTDATVGFSAWCAACHTDFHSASAAFGERHPTAEPIGSRIFPNYTAPNAAEGYAGGTYHYKYPIETNQGAAATTGAQWAITSGTTERVFCMTCHQAHGSQYQNNGRWDFTQPSGVSTGCNKCHNRGI